MDHNHDPQAGGSNMTKMKSFFHWGNAVTLLVDRWTTTSTANYVASLLVLLLASFLYQYLERLTSTACNSRRVHAHAKAFDPTLPAPLRRHPAPLTIKLLITLLFAIRVSLAYLLMLAVMSYNGGVFIAVVLGFSVGFFVFRTDIHAPNVADIPPHDAASQDETSSDAAAAYCQNP